MHTLSTIACTHSYSYLTAFFMSNYLITAFWIWWYTACYNNSFQLSFFAHYLRLSGSMLFLIRNVLNYRLFLTAAIVTSVLKRNTFHGFDSTLVAMQNMNQSIFLIHHTAMFLCWYSYFVLFSNDECILAFILALVFRFGLW